MSASAYSLITYVQMIFAAAVRARRQTRVVFAGSMRGVLVALALVWPFVLACGVNGVLLTMMATGAAVTALFVYVSSQGMTAPGPKLFGCGQPQVEA